ncbi:MAG: sensor histidine kinase [Flavobacteriales bacterium]
MSTEEELSQLYVLLSLVGLCLAVALVFTFVVFNNKKNKLIQENLEQHLKNQSRLHELELQALRSQMNPHFIHNSLNAIQYFIQRNEVELSENYLVKFSKLVRHFFEYSRTKTIPIKDEVTLLKNYLEFEKLRFEDKLSFHLSVDPELDTEIQVMPSMILQPLVENAVNHGVFHNKNKGCVWITFTKLSEEAFQITVEDDGIGFEASRNIKRKNTSKTVGKNTRSSTVLEERITLLKLSNTWDIDYSIQDLSQNDEESQGTRVCLVIKQYSA